MMNSPIKVSFLNNTADFLKNRKIGKSKAVKIIKEKKIIRVNHKINNNRTNSKNKVKVNHNSKQSKIDNRHIYSFHYIQHYK
jgi:hypothetical protein